VEPLAEIYTQPEFLEHMPGRDLEQTRAHVEQLRRRSEDDGFAQWAAEDLETGRLVGRIGLLRHHDWPLEPSPVEVGWALHRDWWGRGLATEGARAAVELWRDVLVDDARLLSITTPANVRSRAVMQRLGLTERGPAHWHGLDVLWYALDR
jgi:RimJ/RimL family protein N-acetyltransferase